MEIPDWPRWEPQMRATLLFVRRGDEVLLIRKKRGLGVGKINAPGGKIEPGESISNSALRETREEVGLVAANPEKMGELHFHFADGLALHCTVFQTRDFTGTAIETEEAIPFWCPVGEIPYGEMWADDAHWLPPMLAEGRKFRGYFTFDGDRMHSHDVRPL